MDVFSPEVLAAALLQLVDETPVPPLFMRTVFSVTTNRIIVFQTLWVVHKHKTLVSFILSELMTTLIRKQVWNDPILWEGFRQCIKVCISSALL